jgi:hypothetical protein
LHHKHDKEVVVIIDEYDAPLHNFLNRPEELEVMRIELSKTKTIGRLFEIGLPDGNFEVLQFVSLFKAKQH